MTKFENVAILTQQEPQQAVLTPDPCQDTPDERNRRKGRHSRRKGAEAERELAADLSVMFRTEVSRGARMYASGKDSPDIIGLVGLHIEVKRREAVNLTSALRQSQLDAAGECPVVMHRPNRSPWLVTVALEDLPRLARTVARLLPDSDAIRTAES